MDESLLALHKEMKSKEPSKEDVNEVVSAARKKFPINSLVAITGTTHEGVVVDYNYRTGGFYPGTRYPVYINITNSRMTKAIGCTFEYGAEQLVVQ